MDPPFYFTLPRERTRPLGEDVRGFQRFWSQFSQDKLSTDPFDQLPAILSVTYLFRHFRNGSSGGTHFARDLEMALFHNSLPFPFPRGSSSPGLLTMALGTLWAENSEFGERSCFSQVESLELPHAQPSYSLNSLFGSRSRDLPRYCRHSRLSIVYRRRPC